LSEGDKLGSSEKLVQRTYALKQSISLLYESGHVRSNLEKF